MNVNLHIDRIIIDDPSLAALSATQLSNNLRTQLSAMLNTAAGLPLPVRPATFAVLHGAPSSSLGGGATTLSRTVANTVHRVLSQPQAPLSRGAR